MAGTDSELYKDKIEVSLDGRQIFYLFFGGAVVACLVFVLGVTVILVGVVVMIYQSIKRPAFFRGRTLSMDAPESLKRKVRR